MPKTVVTAQFRTDNNLPGYTMDIGTEISANGRFIWPPDVGIEQIATILDAIDAQPLSAITEGLCTDSANGKLRKLEFIRSDGSSMSVPVATRDGIYTAANVIRGVLQSTGSGLKVTCIKLVGEFWRNLNEDLGISYTAGQIATSHKPTSESTKQFYYTGNMQYQSDAFRNSGELYFLPIKSISNLQNAPATQIAPLWNGCVGELSNAPACGGGSGSKRKHRRYIFQFATLLDGNAIKETETIEMPLKSSDASAIKTCGQAAAALPGLMCIGYKGESYDKFHKVL
ncbi:MAG: hypothetical protein ACRC2R_22235 [Xenococcaceae cyanobacterium]